MTEQSWSLNFAAGNRKNRDAEAEHEVEALPDDGGWSSARPMDTSEPLQQMEADDQGLLHYNFRQTWSLYCDTIPSCLEENISTWFCPLCTAKLLLAPNHDLSYHPWASSTQLQSLITLPSFASAAMETAEDNAKDRPSKRRRKQHRMDESVGWGS